MNHFATPDFWHCYRQLPKEVRELADKNFALMQQDPRHPSLRLKKVGSFWSAYAERENRRSAGVLPSISAVRSSSSTAWSSRIMARASPI